ncbi:MAG: hypothetical protein HQ546_04885, partial [Planctomycetes bacterium]|nr:hypothetical protein [Planctomycetota bacterium]
SEAVLLKAGRLEQLRQRSETIDVLFVGSSPVHFGIDPRQFERAVAGESAVRAYNAGINGPSFEGVKAALDKFYLTRCDPSVIYIGIIPNDLNCGNVEMRQSTKQFLSLVEQRVPRWLYRVRLFDQRERLGRFMQTLSTGRLRQKQCAGLYSGFEDFSALPRAKWDAVVRLGNLQVNGPPLNSLEAFISQQRSKGRLCVLVNMPMRDDWQRHISDNRYEAYLHALDSVAQKCGAPLVDLMNSGVVNQGNGQQADSDFGDLVHLKSEGAAKLAVRLALWHREFVSEIDQVSANCSY